MIELVGGFDLADELCRPILGYMAIGTNHPHAGWILVVHGFFIFLVNGRAHFMAGDAEFQCIRVFHSRVEPAPENDAGKTAEKKNRAARPAR